MKILILVIFLIVSFWFPIQTTYGHGWGLDTTSIDFDGRQIDVTFELPMYFDEVNKTLKISAYDKEVRENAKNVTFLIGLYHDDKMLFRNYFFAPEGDLMIKVKSIQGDDIVNVDAEQDSFIGAWYATESRPIEISGPIFDSGGLYHFEIEIRTIDEPDNIVEDLGMFVADVSIAETVSFDEQDANEKDITFRIKSYFDKISEFEYDPEKNTVTFMMPFDWDEKVLSHIPVVHEEVHFPKNFDEFLTPSYTGKINDIDLFKANVVIDDYTEEDERIIHFVILQDHLQYLQQEQKRQGKEFPDFMLFTLEVSDEIEFPMIAMTRNEQFQVDLSWDPLQIEPENPTRFVFTIRDGASGEPLKNSSYDFVILQNNLEVYRTSGNAQIGGEFEEFTFSESQTGPIIIRFENIRGIGLETEFGLLVVPEFGIITSLILVISLSAVLILNKKFQILSKAFVS